MKDSLPTRLGGLAANLARVNTFSQHDANKKAVFELINESKYFIEWTAHEAELEVAAQLVDLQIKLAFWQQDWKTIWADKEQRQNISQESRQWSNKVLELSGLLNNASYK
jgi:hypothetical protein